MLGLFFCSSESVTSTILRLLQMTHSWCSSIRDEPLDGINGGTGYCASYLDNIGDHKMQQICLLCISQHVTDQIAQNILNEVGDLSAINSVWDFFYSIQC